MILAQATTAAWTPEQWVLVATSIIASLGAMVTGIIAAVRASAVHAQVVPPSSGNKPNVVNDITNGKLSEDTYYLLKWFADLWAQSQGKPEPPLSLTGEPPDRRSDVPSPVPPTPPAVTNG